MEDTGLKSQVKSQLTLLDLLLSTQPSLEGNKQCKGLLEYNVSL